MTIEVEDFLRINVVLAGIHLLSEQSQRDKFASLVGVEVGTQEHPGHYCSTLVGPRFSNSWHHARDSTTFVEGAHYFSRKDVSHNNRAAVSGL